MARSRRNKRNVKKRIIETISNKNFLIAVGILLAIIIMCLGISWFDHYRQVQKLAQDREILEKKIEDIYQMEQQTKQEALDVQSKANSIIRIAAVGDILCGTEMIEDAKQGEDYNFSSMFANMPSYFEHADIAIGAMETNFCAEQKISGIKKYNSPVSFAKAVKNSGINLITMATNHSYDYGEEGFAETKIALENEGFTVIGAKQEESRVMVKEYRGAKIAFLSYTDKCEGAAASSLVNLYTEENAKKDIEEAKAKADFICVLMHWGEVNAKEVSQEQRDIAGFLVEQGVEMIIGSHSSTVQPIEIVQNQEGKNVLIAYSLGNYISSYKGNHANINIILDVELLRNGENGKVYLKSANYTPLYLLDNGKDSDNRFELVDMKQTAENYAAGDDTKISKKTYEEMKDGLVWVEEIVR